MVCYFCGLIYDTVKALFPNCTSKWGAICFSCWAVHFSVSVSGFVQFCSVSGWTEGRVCLSEVLSLFRTPSKRVFCVLSSLEVTVWRRKAGKGPYPVSLLVPPWQFLLWEICENRRLFSSHNKKITVVPDTSVEHIIERSLGALLLFLYLHVDFVQPRGTYEGCLPVRMEEILFFFFILFWGSCFTLKYS